MDNDFKLGNPFPSGAILRAANECIAQIQKDRDAEIRELLEKKRYRRKYRIFGPKIELSDKEARSRCDRWDILWAENSCEKQFNMAKLIALAAANTVGPVIYLTLDEFRHVGPWMGD